MKIYRVDTCRYWTPEAGEESTSEKEADVDSFWLDKSKAVAHAVINIGLPIRFEWPTHDEEKVLADFGVDIVDFVLISEVEVHE